MPGRTQDACGEQGVFATLLHLKITNQYTWLETNKTQSIIFCKIRGNVESIGTDRKKQDLNTLDNKINTGANIWGYNTKVNGKHSM